MIMIFNFGALQSARRAKCLRQIDVATAIHCTSPTISNTETGHTKITAEMLGVLCELYGIDDMNIFFVKGLKNL